MTSHAGKSSRACALCRVMQRFNLPQPFPNLVPTGERLGHRAAELVSGPTLATPAALASEFT
jgi:hypothetical protein